MISNAKNEELVTLNLTTDLEERVERGCNVYALDFRSFVSFLIQHGVALADEEAGRDVGAEGSQMVWRDRHKVDASAIGRTISISIGPAIAGHLAEARKHFGFDSDASVLQFMISVGCLFDQKDEAVRNPKFIRAFNRDLYYQQKPSRPHE